jgi:hypothetical protein
MAASALFRPRGPPPRRLPAGRAEALPGVAPRLHQKSQQFQCGQGDRASSAPATSRVPAARNATSLP